MITTLAKKSLRQYEVKLLRNIRSKPRDGSVVKIAYQDSYLLLRKIFNDSDRPVGYEFNFRGSKNNPSLPPVLEGSFYINVYYRKHNKRYEGRDFSVVYDDGYVRIIKFGDDNPDYAFLILCPIPKDRVGDKRFSTVPDVHSIEKEELDIEVVIGEDDV